VLQAATTAGLTISFGRPPRGQSRSQLGAAEYRVQAWWTAGGGDAPGADPAKPMAWLAPKPRRAAVFVPLGEADDYLTTCLNLSSNISRPFRYAS
jgi:hypothetical protein